MNQFLQWSEQQSHLILLYFILFFLFLLWVIRFNKPETNKYKLPPSPFKLPIIGNLHQLHGSPHRAFQSLAQKHGPIMLLHLGKIPTLVVSSVDIARDVMKTYDHVFSSRPESEIPKRLFYDKDIAFAPYGEYWRQVRKICVLQLLSAKKVQSFRSVREEEINLMVDVINKFPLSNSVNLSELFVSLTYNIICRVALGRKYSEGERGKKFKAIFTEFTYLLSVSNMGDLIPSLAWVNRLNGINARVEKCFRDIDTFLHEVVEQHINKQRGIYGDDSGDNEEEDFVDVMLGIEKESSFGIPLVRDNTKAIILDMFGAGTDTSSVALEWAMSELIRHPNIMEEVQKEVRDVGRGKLILNENDVEEMHYLKSVIKETLRLHPPAPLLIPHESMEKVQIQGYDIPAKTTVMINVFAIGRDPLWWEEPEKFWPKRFLNGGSTIDFKGQDFQFIPFGAGRRGCPGILFAISVLLPTLANLLNIFDWELPSGMDIQDLDMHEGPGITVHRKNDLFLTAKPHYY
ncbi:hypothetical protein AQUCO_05600019v1 [Aquilegia coerulea]|uniref:Cytochrome P450 n=1 Tax=Aquilegia coerulea TaxID=218851 RepID=A0A2G5CGF0_AQUCA|nr:hypothetical protein AQUCO_05600019v1 [Aquilegia coerulea]